jgi:arylsulfatase A-like enzyme
MRSTLFAVSLLCCACGDEAPRYAGPYRHVLLISLDTTRADHLGCNGDTRGLTPRIDALAARGAVFGQATAPAPTTLASHTSLMTGSYPHTHGVVRNGFTVHADNVMLAEVLRAAGFRTAAVLGSFALESRFAFDQGFELFDESFDVLVTPGGYDQNQRSAARVTDAALAAADAAGGAERLFLFAHYFDAHVPYTPPEDVARARVAPGEGLSASALDVELAVQAQQRRVLGRERVPGLAGVIVKGLEPALLSAADGAAHGQDTWLARLYAAEVAGVDREVGRLLDGLASRGLLEETLVVLTGDHGETFWEHGDYWNHGLWVHETTVHVPLVVALPDGRGAGARVAAPVSTVDVLPTLCELLALPLPARTEGRSLVAALDGAALPRAPVFCEATQPGARLERPGEWGNRRKPHAVRRGPWKYVNAPYLELEQLFHLGSDPGETTDLVAAGALTPPAREALTELRAELLAWLQRADPLPSAFDRTQFDETARRLEALGYGGAEDDEER